MLVRTMAWLFLRKTRVNVITLEMSALSFLYHKNLILAMTLDSQELTPT